MTQPEYTFKTCTDCGAIYQYRKNLYYATLCPECCRVRHRMTNSAYYKRQNKPRYIAREVQVVGIAPWVRDEEERFQLRAFYGSRFPFREFEEGVREECFDGLLVEVGGKRYAVKEGRMEEAA